MKQLKKLYYTMGVSLTMGMMSISTSAFAGGASGSGATASTIASGLNTSLSKLPFLVSSMSYLAGITLGVLGVLKIKDHVENPQQNPLKAGAIRLATGGALLAIPTILNAMVNSMGTSGVVTQQSLSALTFN